MDLTNYENDNQESLYSMEDDIFSYNVDCVHLGTHKRQHPTDDELELTVSEKLKCNKKLRLADDTMDEIHSVSRAIVEYCEKNGILLFNKVNIQKYFVAALSSIDIPTPSTT